MPMGSGSVWWEAEEIPEGYECYENGVGNFTNRGEPVKISVTSYAEHDKLTAKKVVEKISCHDNPHIAKIKYRKFENGVTTLVLDRLGAGFIRWVWDNAPNLALWRIDSGIMIRPEKDFLTVFKGIIKGLDDFIQNDSFHGNLFHGVTVMENKTVKLFWPGEFNLGPKKGVKKDLLDLRDLVGFAVGAVTRKKSLQLAIADKSGWGSCLSLFWETMTERLPECNSHEKLKNFWFFVKNDPLFRDANGCYKLMRKCWDMRFSWPLFLEVEEALGEPPTDMTNWDSNIDTKSALGCIRVGDREGSPISQPGRTCFTFHMDSQEHVKRTFAMLHAEVSEELILQLPDFAPFYYYRLVQKIYEKAATGDINISNLIEKLKESPYKFK